MDKAQKWDGYGTRFGRVGRKGILEEIKESDLDPAEKLAISIVLMACRDWLWMKAKGKTVVKANGTTIEGNRIECERFFRSEWCGVLLGTTGLNGEAILAALDGMDGGRSARICS